MKPIVKRLTTETSYHKQHAHLALLAGFVAAEPPPLLIVENNHLLALGYRELVVFLGNVSGL